MLGMVHTLEKNVSKNLENVQGSKMNLKFTKIGKKVKNMWFCWFFDFYKNHSYLNFYPIFKNLVSECLVEQLDLKKNI